MSAKIFKIFLLAFTIMLNSTAVFANAPVENSEIAKIFEKHNAKGSALIYNFNSNNYTGYNLKRCNQGFLPASTFKIPLTLIALETGNVNLNTIFKWDEKTKEYPTWQKDMNIEEAFKVSNVEIYRELARQIKYKELKEYVSLLNYGQMDVKEENADIFWLEGNSKITQYQQIYFLKNLYTSEFPVNNDTIQTVKKIMLAEKCDNYSLYSKTGFYTENEKPIGWYVGFVERGNNVYFFATNITADDKNELDNFLQKRIDITKDILKLVGAI